MPSLTVLDSDIFEAEEDKESGEDIVNESNESQKLFVIHLLISMVLCQISIKKFLRSDTNYTKL